MNQKENYDINDAHFQESLFSKFERYNNLLLNVIIFISLITVFLLLNKEKEDNLTGKRLSIEEQLKFNTNIQGLNSSLQVKEKGFQSLEKWSGF